MPVQIRQIEHRPAIIVEYSDPYDPVTDVALFIEGSIAHYRPHMTQFFMIHDTRRLSINFSNMLVGLSSSANSDAFRELLSRRGVQIIALYDGNRLVEMATEALEKETYLSESVVAFTTLEDAIAYIDEQLDSAH